MASDLQLVEGFDHLAAETDMTKLVGKGTSTTDGWQGDIITGPEANVDPVTGRDGNGLAIQFATSVTGGELDFVLPTDVPAGGTGGEPNTSNPDGANNGSICGGFAFRLDDLPSDLGEAAEPILAFVDTGGTARINIALHRGGFLVYDPTNFATSGTSLSMAATQPCLVGVWHYIQFDLRLGNNQNNNTEFTLWIDGRAQGVPAGDTQFATHGSTTSILSGRYAEYLNLPGWDTTTALRTVRFVKNDSTFGYSIDDLWLSSYLTAYESSIFEGDTRNGRAYDRDFNPGPVGASMPLRDPQVRTFFPTADGNQNDWTPFVGANWEDVDDNAHDTDTTYVESSTSGHIDLYEFANHASDADNIPASWMSCNVKDTTSLSPNMIFRTRHATIETDFGSEDTTNTGYEQKGTRVRRDVGATPSDIPLTITNPGAESEVTTGAITGWTKTGEDTAGIATEDTGTPPTAVPGGGGSNWFSFDGATRTSPDKALLSQDVLTSTDAIPDRDIDEGNLTIEWTGTMMESGGSEDGVLVIYFLDANGFDIPHTARLFSPLNTAGDVWEVETTGDLHVPPGTRTFRLQFGAAAGATEDTEIYWDLMNATVKYIDDQAEFTPTESDAAEMGIHLT